MGGDRKESTVLDEEEGEGGVCVWRGGGAERSHRHTGKRGSYSAATGENPTHESVGK